MCLQRRKYLVSRASGLTHSGIGPVYDITMPLFNGRPPQIHQRIVDNLNELDSGNLLQRSRELDVTRLRRITVKSAEALLSAHAEGLVHGCVWPGAFCLTEDSITLLDVGLYKLKQIHQDNIPVGSAQHYKAREELKMSPVDPTQAMDIHSWGKTIISLYTHLPFITSLSNIVPPIPPRPQEMPDDIWNIVVQCLSEYLDIGVTMEDVVYQLTGI